MPNPFITPITSGQPTYTIANANGVIAELNLTISPGVDVNFQVNYPSSAMGVTAFLFKGSDAGNTADPAHTVNLLPGHPVNDTTTITGRRVQASTSTVGTNTILSCTVGVAGISTQEDWTLYVLMLAGSQCVVTKGGDTNVNITRVICDPVASFVSPATVKENDKVTLIAVAGTGKATQPTVVGTPVPALYYRWTFMDNISIPIFNTACGTEQSFVFTAPTSDTTIQLQEQVWYSGSWFGGGCSSVPIPPTPPVPPVPLLTTKAGPVPLTIQSSPQALMILLDRTGSMTGAKWDNAKIAARLLAELFVAFRKNDSGSGSINPNDRVGIVGFDDTGCAWASPANLVPLLAIAGSTPSDALATKISTLTLDPLGACTPIGDVLIEGMKELTSLNLTPTDGPSYTMILLTDGIENSGSVRVDSNTVIPAGVTVQDFATARNGNAISAIVNTNLALYTIGIGADVQEEVLNALAASPAPGSSRNGKYINVLNQNAGALNPRDVLNAAVQELTFSFEANQFNPYPMGALPAGSNPDPTPPTPTNSVYFPLGQKTNRLAVAILSSSTTFWNDGSDDIGLAYRSQKDASNKFTGPFTIVQSSTQKCTAFGFTSVNVANLFLGGQSKVTDTEWRVTHFRQQIEGGGLPLAIDLQDLLLVQDLYLKAEVLFDKNEYRTGEPIHVTCRIAAGPTPVTGAVVAVTLKRPGAGLGNFLSVNPFSGPLKTPGGADPLSPKYAALEQLLKQLHMTGLPVLHPPAIFPDGSAFLFDDGQHDDGIANNGVYSNTYVDTDMEGTYTFNFTIEGKLADGSVFNRVITVSKWVGVAVDPINSFVSAQLGAVQGAMQTAQVYVRPRDAGGQFLGPFRTGEIDFTTSSGAFQGSLTSKLDGSYVQTLTYPVGQVPTVGVTVHGNNLLPRRTTNSGFMVQSSLGVKGNFELVVPQATSGLALCERDNDKSPTLPWHGPTLFGEGAGKVEAVSLIQSNFGSPGNLEVVARVGQTLVHLWRDSGPYFAWSKPEVILEGVTGNPALIQGRFGTRGNFELVVPLVNGGIAYYSRDNDNPHLPWKREAVFAEEGGLVDAVALIQSNYGSPGNLEVIARVRGYLMHFWRDSGPAFIWHGPQILYTGASGIPGFIQSKFGNRGNFEVVTPLSKGGMALLERDNDSPLEQWKVLDTFGSGNVTAVSLLQSDFTTSPNPDSPGPGNLEVAARVDNRTALYWRRDEAPLIWLGPTAYACS